MSDITCPRKHMPRLLSRKIHYWNTLFHAFIVPCLHSFRFQAPACGRHHLPLGRLVEWKKESVFVGWKRHDYDYNYFSYFRVEIWTINHAYPFAWYGQNQICFISIVSLQEFSWYKPHCCHFHLLTPLGTKFPWQRIYSSEETSWILASERVASAYQGFSANSLCLVWMVERNCFPQATLWPQATLGK